MLTMNGCLFTGLPTCLKIRLCRTKHTGNFFSLYMDVESAAQIVSGVHGGTIRIHMGPVSMLGAQALFTSSRDQIPPPTADQAVISTLKRRLMQQDVSSHV